jgi:hypothetical protein
MERHILSIQQVKEIDIIEYLAKLGYQPQKIRLDDHWFLSPLREEKTASFKVNRKQNLWFCPLPGYSTCNQHNPQFVVLPAFWINFAMGLQQLIILANLAVCINLALNIWELVCGAF